MLADSVQNIKLLEIRGCQRVAVQSSIPSKFSLVCQDVISTGHRMTVGAKKDHRNKFWHLAEGGRPNCSVPDEHSRDLKQPKEKNGTWDELYASETKTKKRAAFSPVEPALVVHVDLGQSGECV